jgi:phospholipid/cholesterol/gamma-HCH transport system ATP-binding protein
MVTHDLDTAFATSQRFTFLHKARMLFEGSEAEMKSSSIPEVREFLGPTDSSLFYDIQVTDGKQQEQAERYETK